MGINLLDKQYDLMAVIKIIIENDLELNGAASFMPPEENEILTIRPTIALLIIIKVGAGLFYFQSLTDSVKQQIWRLS